MSTIVLQSIAAGLIVLACALYAAWRLASPRARLWLLDRIAGSADAHDARASGWRVRLRASLSASAGSGCHDCAAAAPKRRSGARP